MSILLEGAGAGAGLKGLLHLQILDKIVLANDYKYMRQHKGN